MDQSQTRPKGRRYAGKSLEQRRLLRRQLLVDAGLQMFGTKGFTATTVRDICGSAGLTERYFYESFDSREALFAAVYDIATERIRSHVSAAMARQVAEGRGAVVEVVRAGLGAYFELNRQEPLIARVTLVEVFNSSSDPGRLARRTGTLAQELIVPLTHAVKGEGLALDLVAAGAMGAVIFIAMRWTLGGYEESEQTVVDSAMALLRPVIEPGG